MKKVLLVVTISLVLSVSLTACTKSTSQIDNSNAQKNAPTATPGWNPSNDPHYYEY